MNSSSKISCLIIDDELSSQKVLQYFIGQTPLLEVKETCSNAADAFKYLQLNPQIDLLFLDINMPQKTGLDFYKTLPQKPAVIFTTAYPQYAVEGFEVNATDYLLKPFSYERFLTAINKILVPKENDFIIVKENKTLHKVMFNDINYVEAFGDYVKVHLDSITIITHSTFTDFLKTLTTQFLRIHKSYCINTNKIKSISGNQIQISKHKLPIGQTYKSKVFKALNL